MPVQDVNWLSIVIRSAPNHVPLKSRVMIKSIARLEPLYLYLFVSWVNENYGPQSMNGENRPLDEPGYVFER